jgi:hypothetical protein
MEEEQCWTGSGFQPRSVGLDELGRSWRGKTSPSGSRCVRIPPWVRPTYETLGLAGSNRIPG